MLKSKTLLAIFFLLTLFQSPVCLGQAQVWLGLDTDAESVKAWAGQSSDRYWIEGGQHSPCAAKSRDPADCLGWPCACSPESAFELL